ncbi:phosphoribosylformylglycinamidine synthase subunit PurL [Miltoncostaea oceani]|uniref:phosphoribosylformylglycinamidine synthase subunit PurL n=1 Tax=Miltoncostaea oceani TaxID=2843216 RepID=UPI001C3D6295|nr:phosphoribosylformylglycinamidine synthase subunit PurL [Miltoncostaea oceani]
MSTRDLPRHRQLGLTDDEAARIPELLGRTPTDPELVMFSLMWSEHCSYKHSRPLLSGFPTTGPRVLQGPGENAGVIDVGDGIAVALKIESHNHPSAVEPFEGAATGVGGIVRDIIAMGARPIALLDSLRFGELTSARSRHLFTRAVAGIGHYGNCIGVPTVGGEVVFDDRYEESCLVNAMCVGIVEGPMLRAAASGPGNALVLIGNRTGADGIGGASVLASAELDDEDKRPSVQVSDPFTERKLMDCCLELAAAGAFVALQDLGAAGLTSAASEMAAKGRLGLDIDLDLVPLREELQAAEILVSESQERMLAVVEPGRVDEVVAVCRRWDLDATAIGSVTEGENLVARHRGEVVVDLPARLLADEAPVYEVPRTPAAPPPPLDRSALPEPADLAAAWLDLLARPNIASKRWVYERYDHLVGANTIRRPGGDAAVVRLPGSDRAIALTTDCAERHCERDPRGGGRASVLEAARNLACVGARPVAATDCLNFPNPEKGSTGWRLAEAIAGMSEALVALEVPVVSGNVSLYNESATRAILPTPVVGMMGLLERADSSVGQGFGDEGDVILLIGDDGSLDASEYVGGAGGAPPDIDVGREVAGIGIVLRAAEEGLLTSAHDVSAGGLAVALAESALIGGVGAAVDLPSGARDDEVAFGEGGGRMIVTVRSSEDADRVAMMGRDTVAVTRIGRVGGDAVTLRIGGRPATIDLAAARAAHEGTLPEALA